MKRLQADLDPVRDRDIIADILGVPTSERSQHIKNMYRIAMHRGGTLNSPEYKKVVSNNNKKLIWAQEGVYRL